MYLARHIHVFGAPHSCIGLAKYMHARFMYLARQVHECGAPHYISAAARQRSVKGFYGHPGGSNNADAGKKKRERGGGGNWGTCAG